MVVLTRDAAYRKTPSRGMAAFRLRYKKYPNLIKQMEYRHIRYNKTLDFIEKGRKMGKIFVIRPPKPIEIGRVEKDKEKLRALYEEGYETVRDSYEGLAEFLKG